MRAPRGAGRQARAKARAAERSGTCRTAGPDLESAGSPEGPRRPPAPVVALDALTGGVAAWATGRLLSAAWWHEQYGEAPRIEARPNEPGMIVPTDTGVRVVVFDVSSLVSQAVWHAYWSTRRDASGAYDVHNAALMADAPPRPTAYAEYVAEATWDDVAAWLVKDRGLSLGDLLEARR